MMLSRFSALPKVPSKPRVGRKFKVMCGFTLSVAMLAGAQEGVKFLGDVQIQGIKSFTRGWGGNNLDDFWGRVNFGAEYKDSSFESKFNMRVYPEGFGFEPVIGATYDTTGQGSVKLATSAQSRTIVNNAWVRQNFRDFSVRVGRFETRSQPSFFLGNYIDLAPGGSADGRFSVHNATEITSKNGALSSSVLLGANDKNLNKGFFRIYERYEAMPSLAVTAAYRCNIFDKVYDQDAEVLNRFDASAHWTKSAKQGALIEGAFLQKAGTEDQIPVFASVYSSVGIIDKVAIEAEFLADRKVQGEDKPIILDVFMAYSLFKRARFDAALFSDPMSGDFADVGAAIRFTCGLY